MRRPPAPGPLPSPPAAWARGSASALTLLLVLVASGCAYESAGTTTTTVTGAEELPPPTGPAALVFEDQLVDGSAVVVASVTLPADGFVVLAADAGGVPGEVVGVSELIRRGTVTAVVVPLFLPLAQETVLHAALHVDMDRNGQFLYEPPDGFVDLPAVSGEGVAVTASATVGLLPPVGPAAVTLEPQRITGMEVVVAEVILPAPGFVALQASLDGLPGPILGISPLLPAGTSTAVAVALEEAAPGPQTIFAVAYVDRDGDGVARLRAADSLDEVALGFDGRPARASAEVTVVAIRPAAVEVEDQEGDGSVVRVASTTLPSPGFVELRLDEGGAPGRRLAASDLLPAGTTTGVELELRSPLAGDAGLWVRVRIDLDGDGALGEEDPIALTAEGRRAQSRLAYTFVEED